MPAAPELHANQTVAWVLIVLLWAGAAATLAWALWKLSRQDHLPIVLFLGGLIACNIEPLGDYVGSIVYANDVPWISYTMMGHRMPAFILVGAASYVTIGGYIAYRYLAEGRSLKQIFMLSAVYVGIPEIIGEMVMYHFHIIKYFGENPTRIYGIPLYSIVQNTTLLPVYGIVIYFAVRYLKGAQLLWLIPFIPAVTIGYIVGVSWPAYQTVTSSSPAWAVWVAAAYVIATSIAITYYLLQISELKRRRGTAAASVRVSAVEPTSA